MNDDIKLPKDARAVIAETGVMGGKAVIIEYDKICSGDDCAKSGDYLKGVTRTFIQAMLQADEMGNFMGDMTTGLKDVLNDQIGPESETDLAKSLRSLSASLDNIKGITLKMDVLVDRSSGKIDGTLANIQSITKNLDDNKRRINSILGSVDTFSNQLTKIELETAVANANKAIEELSTTLESTNKAVANVNDLVTKVNTGEGTLGKLIKDDELYNDLDRMSKSIDSLANDFQARPYRYVPFKSRRKVKKNDKKDAKEAATDSK
jgi:phospholipid/cholesterol/gamma-HCH transport system substrate-binding protein